MTENVIISGFFVLLSTNNSTNFVKPIKDLETEQVNGPMMELSSSQYIREQFDEQNGGARHKTEVIYC